MQSSKDTSSASAGASTTSQFGPSELTTKLGDFASLSTRKKRERLPKLADEICNLPPQSTIKLPIAVSPLGPVGGQLFVGEKSIFTESTHYHEILFARNGLNELNTSGQEIKDDSGFNNFLIGLSRLPREITKIDLSSATYTPEQMGRLLEILKDHPIKEIKLAYCNFSHEHYQAMAPHFKNFKHLETLDFRGNLSSYTYELGYNPLTLAWRELVGNLKTCPNLTNINVSAVSNLTHVTTELQNLVRSRETEFSTPVEYSVAVSSIGFGVVNIPKLKPEPNVVNRFQDEINAASEDGHDLSNGMRR